jgi:2,4-dienoyl-CoA reductase (NADPH2)
MVKGTELEDLPAIVRYLERQVTRLEVKVRFGKEVDSSVIEEMKPDVVILATGGIPTIPQITGINRSNVISGGDLHRRLRFYLRFFGPGTLRWLTKLFIPIGKRVVVIGGSIHGCELAEFLTRRGRKVTLVDTKEVMGDGMVDAILGHLLMWFKKKGVTLISGVKEYVEITDKGLTLITKEGKKMTIEADTIIPALPLTPNMELLKSLGKKVPEIYAVGDCKEPLLIADAIGTSLRTALGV